MTDKEKQDALFGGLVMMFHAAAMQQMGKIKNPSSNELERNLEQAQMSIDMLDMLEQKTKGNLTEEQARFLKNVQQECKLNYVDEMSKEQGKANPS